MNQQPILAVRFTRPHADLPTRAHPTDAGLDLYAAETVHVIPNQVTLVPTGVAVAIPAGHVGLLIARSSLAVKKSMTLANGVGVIDPDYRGEIQVPITPLDGCRNLIQAGTRIAQLVILPIALPRLDVVAELPESVRGLGGFGSSDDA
ncbi:dUTP diphosphatase [Fictibacillus arsenicus]|uniref:dUTP diphosphatase n=1 Tax=Fictibacillus arsenicus TaxID=255247 RepID=A0A1V3FZA8_9BACL|nr:dUTP diphosphatase [Fictibacillus arsenicus]OOE07018.1 hypothetical protein UN64_19565 [Fictibacillus arsenicus]